MYSTQFCKQKTYINGIAAQKFDYNMRNKRGKISIVEQYRKIIVLMYIKNFEAQSIRQGYFFSVAIPLVTPRELLKVAFLQRV